MTWLDWAVIAAYGAAVLVIGVRAGRGHQTADDYFLGGRRMPVWAVFCSMVATELSAATFIGVPHAAYKGDWFYLQFAFGALAGKVVVAFWFIRLYHRLGLVTVYGLLEQRLGRATQVCSAWFFLVGRVLASGVRLFIAGLAFATVTGLSIEWAIVLAGILAGIYTLAGGIRAVIWTDTLQGAVFLVAAVTTLVVVGLELTGGLAAGFEGAAGRGKVQVFHFPPFLAEGTRAEDVWAHITLAWENFVEHYLGGSSAFVMAVMGGFFLTLATHGTDQDMVQRLLTTRDGRSGGRALLWSGLANFPLTLLFLGMGTALWAFYHSGASTWGEAYSIADDERIFPIFVFHEVPAGLRGLIFAGLFAAAMSSLDSAMNALATTWSVDVRRSVPPGARQLGTSKRAIVAFALLLVGAALFFNFYYEEFAGTGEGSLDLVQFALSAMTIIYGGLLGAFLLALVGRRGSDRGVLLAMVVGGLVGLALFLQPVYLPQEEPVIAWVWNIPIAALVTFAVGSCGPRRED